MSISAEMSGKPRKVRRKDERPREIIVAALEVFAVKGFSATRLDDVAERAGISKGTIYLYFNSKEDLFKAAVKHTVIPILDAVEDTIKTHEGSMEDLIRTIVHDATGQLMKTRILPLQLIIADGTRFPELADFYYDEVISRAMSSTRIIIHKGIETGEFRETAFVDYPMLLQAPIILSMLLTQVFDKFEIKDMNKLVDTHLDLLFRGLRKLP